MMRIGATIADSVPFKVANDTSKIDVLDRVPGTVGDVSGNHHAAGGAGEIGLGAAHSLSTSRRYDSYDVWRVSRLE